MPFNIFTWLFTDPATAGSNGNLPGSEPFHYFWPYLIACGVGLLIWFYYWVEGRKRFLKSDKDGTLKDKPLKDRLLKDKLLKDKLLKGKPFVKGNVPLMYMLDIYLNWLAVICFIGIPIDLSRYVLDSSFFAWRFWRYLWLVALLVWAVLWVIYFVRVYTVERKRFILGANDQTYRKNK